MILEDQVFSGLLWFGLVYAVYALHGVYGHMARGMVWYKSGMYASSQKHGGRAMSDQDVAAGTWYGQLHKVKWLPSTAVMLVLGFLAYTALGYASWRVWTFDGTHTDIFGQLFFGFNLGLVLLTAVFGLMFYEARSVLLGVVNVLLKLLLAAASMVFVGLLTWNASHALLDGMIDAFIVFGVFGLYALFELVVYGALYAKQRGDDDDDSDEESYDKL